MKHITSKLLSLLLTLAMLLSIIPAAYAEGTEGTTEGSTSTEKVVAKDGETTATTETLDGSTTVTGTNAATAVGDGTETNPYTLEQLSKMTRDAYIEAQTRLGGTMYVTVGDYSYVTNGSLGNGVRNDKPGQTEDRNVLNGYNSNGYLGEKNDGANGKNIVFVGGSITSDANGYTSIDNIGTSLLLAVPAYTNVTFEGITFNNVMSFDYQLYTGPWSQLGELKFDGCTFNGIIVGAIAAQTLTFNGCEFENYTNEKSANNSNPTWIRPAYGNWKKDDNEGQGDDFRSLTTINFTGNKVTSTRPVKFEYISQWDIRSKVTATGNYFDISAQKTDEPTEIKNVGLYLGAHTDANAFDLVVDNNTKSDKTAALYTIPKGKTSLPAGSTVKDTAGKDIELTDALKWKGTKDDGLTLKTECEAKIGNAYYATLPDAITAADENATVTLLKDVTVIKPIEVTKSMTLDLNGHVLTAATASDRSESKDEKNSAIWVTAKNVNLTINGMTAGSGMKMGDTHNTEWKTKVWGFVDLREGSAGSTVTINGGSYTGSTCASDSYHYTALFTVGSESKLVLNNVSAETDERVVKASGCGEVIVSGGTYNITGINAFLGAAFETKTASFTDMKLTAKYGGCVQVGSNATLENCEIKVTDIRTGDGTYLNCAVAVQYGGTATVKSGTYTAPYAAYVYNSGGTINIENGTFTGVVRADATTDTTAVINIKNGSFNGEIQKGGGPGSETISITGGTFSFDPSTKVKNNGTDYIVKRAGSEGAYTYTVLAKSGLTSGVYLTDPSGALASNYYVSSTANGVWTVSYSAPSSGGGSSSSSRRYDVSAPSVKHGDVTVSPKSASKGDTVTITVKPDSGYELDTLTVKDASGSKIKVKDKGDGKFTFTMPASKVTVSAEFAEIETLDFADVPTDAYYYEAVKWAAKKGITGGIGNGLFGPNQPCTRAQIVTFLWRAAGSPEPKTMSSFADVSMDAYYAKAVAWAVENGITTGTGDGKFSPDATCTRAQSVTFLFRAIGKLVDSKAEFSDVLTDSYYANAVAWAVENGVTNGIGDGLFGPDNSCTRAQIVTFLYRAYQGK